MAANTKTKTAENAATADEAKTTATQTAPETQPAAEQDQPVYDVDNIKRLAKLIDENLRFSLRETLARIEAEFDVQPGRDARGFTFVALGIEAKGTTDRICLTNWGNAARRKLRQLGS